MLGWAIFMYRQPEASRVDIRDLRIERDTPQNRTAIRQVQDQMVLVLETMTRRAVYGEGAVTFKVEDGVIQVSWSVRKIVNR